MISFDVQHTQKYIDKPEFERNIHYICHKLLLDSPTMTVYGIETTLMDYLNNQDECAEVKVKCCNEPHSFNVVLDVRFRYNECGAYDWRAIRLTYDPNSITKPEPTGWSDNILFGCELDD